jgi:hypothetical protein
MYSTNPHTLDELQHSTYEALRSVDICELKLVSRDLKFTDEQKGGYLSICCDGYML